MSPKCGRGLCHQVQFFAGTNLLGVRTNEPFNLVWQVVHERFATGVINVAAPDRVSQGAGNITINQR